MKLENNSGSSLRIMVAVVLVVVVVVLRACCFKCVCVWWTVWWAVAIANFGAFTSHPFFCAITAPITTKLCDERPSHEIGVMTAPIARTHMMGAAHHANSCDRFGAHVTILCNGLQLHKNSNLNFCVMGTHRTKFCAMRSRYTKMVIFRDLPCDLVY